MNKAEITEYLHNFTKKIGVRCFLNDSVLSDQFSGNELIVAEVFKEKLLHQLKSFGLGSAAIGNARIGTMRQLCKPVVLDVINPCTRCSGTGKMPFKHILGGVCFKCKGTGSNK